MTVDVNYLWIAVLLIAVVLLIIWLIRRNRKDEKDYEKEIINSELEEPKHNENKDSDTTP